jgi:hypothetical protein
MAMKKKCLLIVNIILLGVGVSSDGNAQSKTGDKESARIFVQKFYDWYTILFNAEILGKKQTVSPEAAALSKKKECFDNVLREALIEDDKAQAKADEIVGLDSDPFLAAQDNGFAYQTGSVKQVGNKFLVDVHCDQIGKSRKAILAAEVAVVAEVVKTDGHWIFTNFIYPDEKGKTDLLTVLSNLAKDRVKWAAEKKKKATK